VKWRIAWGEGGGGAEGIYTSPKRERLKSKTSLIEERRVFCDREKGKLRQGPPKEKSGRAVKKGKGRSWAGFSIWKYNR